MEAALSARIKAAFDARPAPGRVGRDRPGCTGHEGRLVAEVLNLLCGRDPEA